MLRQPSAVSIRSLFLAVALIGGLAACASEDDSSAAPTSVDGAGVTTTAASDGEPDDTDADTDADTGADGAGTGTLTMADGTVYELEMSACDTSENSSGFVLPDSYDLFGRTADGAFKASFNRAGLDETFITEISTLEGDENGQNDGLIYQDVSGTMALTVDGGNVSGTLTMKPVGPVRPHGDEIEATVDVTC